MKKKKAESARPLSGSRPVLRRGCRLTVALNDEERKMLDRFVGQYKIRNRSKWVRETLMSAILRQLEADYPTLFAEREMK